MADFVCIPQKTNECPEVKYLNRHVVPEVAAACAYQPDVWRTLGIELLGEDGVTQLDVIKANNSDVTKCSLAMLTLWRQQKIDASWSQLIEALKRLKLNRVAAEIERGLESPMEQDETTDPVQVVEVIPTQRQDYQAKDSSQEESRTASSSTVYTANSQSKALVKFSKNWDIEAAYSNMTSTVETILTAGDFPQLRRACIHKIKSLKSKLPHKLIPQIKTTSCMNELLDTLAESEYWNWFDTRLLEALTYASGSPEAIQLLEHFKKTFYPRKISEFIPYQLVKPFKEFVSMKDKFDKEPSEVTVYELLEHRYKLEYEVLDIDEGELVLSCIKTGCVELTWQLPQELVYCAYISMKRKHDELSSLAVKSLICEIADVYAGLPILWCGQEVGEVGPIEPLPKHVRQEPYSLPQGFHWVSLSSSDAEEVEKFSYKHGQSLLNLSVFIFDFCSQYPNNRNEWQFSIKTANGKLASVVLAYPITMIVGGVSLTCVYPYMLNHLKYIGKRLWFVIIKELMRRVSSYNINHFVFSIPKSSVLKPVSTVHLWKYYFDHSTSSQLHSSPRTPGWRRMTLEDVPSALALINKWSSQFEIRQVFISEEEFMYHFLSATPLSSMITYIVENETNNITDLVSFRFKDVSHGDVMITAVVSTQSPVKQLIIDALVCVKENGGKSLLILQNDIKPDVLVSLSFQYAHTLTYSIYNYRYHEISGNKFYCFAF